MYVKFSIFFELAWIRKRNFKLFKLKLPEQSNPPKYTHDSMFGGPDWSLGS